MNNEEIMNEFFDVKEIELETLYEKYKAYSEKAAREIYEKDRKLQEELNRA